MDDILTQEFYKKQYRSVARYIIKNSGTEEEAKDAFQEAWHATLLKHRAGEHIGDYGRFLFECAKNAYLKECKRKQKFVPLDLHTAEEDELEGDDAHAAAARSDADFFAEMADSAVEEMPASAMDGPAPLAHTDEEKNPLHDLRNWGQVAEALLLLSALHQRILHLSLGLGWNTSTIAAEVGGYTEGAMAVEKSRAYNALRQTTAKLLHERGNSYFKKIGERKKAEKAARRTRDDKRGTMNEEPTTDN